uniref:Large ribosomal subunit protein bL32c n=1 Tax=Ophidocladus simpliciusculus TaxID=1261574 RepID=A0A1Z1MJC1_9FLOR|nr:ribosomal protein L32 [Ophidocladus simpliciusculus]ARW65915.1 ribosomal protein L32 [Ophidocladus simpliciusculus]
MAVPKRKTSKSKSRKSCWKNKADLVSQKSLSLAKSILSGKSTSFIYYKQIKDEI